MTDEKRIFVRPSIFTGGVLSWLSGFSHSIMPNSFPFSIVSFFKQTLWTGKQKTLHKKNGSSPTPSLFPTLIEVDQSISATSKKGHPTPCATDPSFDFVQLKNNQGNVVGWEMPYYENDYIPVNVMNVAQEYNNSVPVFDMSINAFDDYQAVQPQVPPLQSSKFVMRRNSQTKSGFAPYDYKSRRQGSQNEYLSDRSDSVSSAFEYSPEMADRQSPPELMYSNSPATTNTSTENSLPVAWNEYQEFPIPASTAAPAPIVAAAPYDEFMLPPHTQPPPPLQQEDWGFLDYNQMNAMPIQQVAPPQHHNHHQQEVISPVSSVSSHSYQVYDHHSNSPADPMMAQSPVFQQPSPESNITTPASHISTPASTASYSSNNPAPTSNATKHQFVCESCGAAFRIKGYLTRHMKKHASKKAYNCPFYDPKAESPCHPSGGFSRRDTYKTHLKARHFSYPSGTRSEHRAKVAGTCGGCGKHYENNENWVEEHIQKGLCGGIIRMFAQV